MKKLMKYRLICLFLLSSGLAAACGDTYRYPCQDPAKANTPECQCGVQPRTKNKALNAVELGATTTTLRLLAGFDC